MADDIRIRPMPDEAFLVKDESLHDGDAPFFTWLKEHGFEHGMADKGRYEICDWVYVNITHKTYAYGMPGCQVVTTLGNHAITIDDFYTIYGIFEKYDGLGALVFTKEEQEKLDKEAEEFKAKFDEYIRNLTYEEYRGEVEAVFFEMVGHDESTEAFVKENEEMIQDRFIGYTDPSGAYGWCNPASTARCLELMYD
ncbi:MAG: hypothetical protein J5379_04345 [Clostridiales bacterium]|nr:hypothetical protein [Clostridiales bacterium]